MSKPKQTSIHIQHNNQRLFSDHYLNNRIGQLEEWERCDVSLILSELQTLWNGFNGQPHEAETEDKWIRPILKKLGHFYKIQPALKTPQGTKEPDYVLFPDQEGVDRFGDGTKTEVDFGSVLAVCEAKRWERSLDKKSGGNGNSLSDNPARQIDFYMRYSGVTWGVLTNGRKWRLYHKESSKAYNTHYYEVDLVELIESGDAKSFKFFWLFFRKEAFVGKGAFLTTILEESNTYQKALRDNLSEQVYSALRALAQGFINYPKNGFVLPLSDDSLTQIYDNSLILLYRILFVLYAESRQILPIKTNSFYTESYSLQSLKKRIASEIKHNVNAAESIATFWSRLDELWKIINEGNPELDVPTYNGGLFDPDKHPFLETMRVGDLHLRTAIDWLTREFNSETDKWDAIDYQSLSTRHLGSIYEGLLEHKLAVAERPLSIVKENNEERYVPATDDATADIQTGSVYLITDKNKRQVTASYYTPDPIVQYMVKQTIEPVMNTVLERHTQDDECVDEEALIVDMLEINVLDPAMGSGHFLVAVADFMAVYMDDLELGAADGQEDSKKYWMRRIVQSCIYGVDLNRLAVDLAKLSLWLETVDRDRPLNFLHHHLQWGNSLVGAWFSHVMNKLPSKKKKKQTSPNQMGLFGDNQFAVTIKSATDSMTQIETLSGDTIDDVKQAETLYTSDIDQAVEPYRQLFDVWTAYHLGLDLDNQTWENLLLQTQSNPHINNYEPLLERTNKLDDSYQFFHWELKFPDLFFNRDGSLKLDGGFDAIIGNPPYITYHGRRGKPISNDLLQFYRQSYDAILDKEKTGKYNSAIFFIEIFCKLCKPDGRIGIITDISFYEHFYDGAKKMLLEKTAIQSIVNGLQAWDDVGSGQLILTAKKNQVNQQHIDSQAQWYDAGLESDPLIINPQNWNDETTHYQFYVASNDATSKLIAKIEKTTTVLSDHFPHRLVRTGASIGGDDLQEFIEVERLSNSGSIPIYDYLEGAKSLSDRFVTPKPTRYFRLDVALLDEKNQRNREKAKQSGRKHSNVLGMGDRLAFDNPKILVRQSCDHICATYSDQPSVYNRSFYSINSENSSGKSDFSLLYTVAILNSKLITFYAREKRIIRMDSGKQPQIRLGDLKTLPIPIPTDTEQQQLEAISSAIFSSVKKQEKLRSKVTNRIYFDLILHHSNAKIEKIFNWWESDFSALRQWVKSILKRDLPLAERDEWEEYLIDQRNKYNSITEELSLLDSKLNEAVYQLFNLTPNEIQFVQVQDTTKRLPAAKRP